MIAIMRFSPSDKLSHRRSLQFRLVASFEITEENWDQIEARIDPDRPCDPTVGLLDIIPL